MFWFWIIVTAWFRCNAYCLNIIATNQTAWWCFVWVWTWVNVLSSMCVTRTNAVVVVVVSCIWGCLVWCTTAKRMASNKSTAAVWWLTVAACVINRLLLLLWCMSLWFVVASNCAYDCRCIEATAVWITLMRVCVVIVILTVSTLWLSMRIAYLSDSAYKCSYF